MSPWCCCILENTKNHLLFLYLKGFATIKGLENPIPQYDANLTIWVWLLYQTLHTNKIYGRWLI